MRSALNILYTSHCGGGRHVMAVSASSASVWSQFLGLVCMLYLGPFCRMFISASENCMSVMLTTLG